MEKEKANIEKPCDGDTATIAEQEAAETDVVCQDEAACEDIEEKTCANCGTVSTGNFCPNCGQSMMIGRLRASNLYKQTISSVLRLDPLFLKTVWQLIIRPWKVISDYLSGHQVCYMAPMTTLVFLFFFRAILNTIMGAGSDESLRDIWNQSYGFPAIQETIIKLGKTILYIDIITLILMRIPMVLAVKTVYSRTKGAAYTWAEYAAASVYALSAITAVTILMDIFVTPFAGDKWSDFIQSIYGCVIIFLILHKLFDSKSVWQSIRRYILTMLLGCIYYVIYFIVIVLVIAVVIYTADPSAFEKM